MNVIHLGDDGNTSLATGERLYKSNPRIEAIGQLDSVNADIGLVYSHIHNHYFRTILHDVEKGLRICSGHLAKSSQVVLEDLYCLQAELNEAEVKMKKALSDRQVKLDFVSYLSFKQSVAFIHQARARTREAERAVEAVHKVSLDVIMYLNRLSTVLWYIAYCLEEEINIV